MKFSEATHCKVCGIIIKNSRFKQKSRALCIYCHKREAVQRWEERKDKVNEMRRPLRRKPKTSKVCICCSVEFETARPFQKTCGSKECQALFKKVLDKIARKEKRVTYNKLCTVCKKPFSTTHPRVLNCSKECIETYRKQGGKNGLK